MITYFVRGDKTALQIALSKHPSVALDERFSPAEANVKVPHDVSDDFTDELESLGLEYQMV